MPASGGVSPLTVGSPPIASPARREIASMSAPSRSRTGTTRPSRWSRRLISRCAGSSSGFARAAASDFAEVRAAWDLVVNRSACIKLEDSDLSLLLQEIYMRQA